MTELVTGRSSPGAINALLLWQQVSRMPRLGDSSPDSWGLTKIPHSPIPCT